MELVNLLTCLHKNRIRPGPFAGRGGVSWCHLLYPHRHAFGCHLPQIQSGIWERQGGGFLDCAVTGARVSLTTALVFARPCESNLVKWISLLIRPSHTDRWLSVQLSSYLSSRCLVARDYTLLQKRVKQNDLHIIGISTLNGENTC